MEPATTSGGMARVRIIRIVVLVVGNKSPSQIGNLSFINSDGLATCTGNLSHIRLPPSHKATVVYRDHGFIDCFHYPHVSFIICWGTLGWHADLAFLLMAC